MKLYAKGSRKIFVASVSASIGQTQYDACPKVAVVEGSKSGSLGDDYHRKRMKVSTDLLKAGFGI
ncbi:MAG: hypothetical protein KGH66_01985 [Candidatus Micrarchaeota archaeon]|nr:hypothetical protein [Candidatus Micrarchaeota archaeon]